MPTHVMANRSSRISPTAASASPMPPRHCQPTSRPQMTSVVISSTARMRSAALPPAPRAARDGHAAAEHVAEDQHEHDGQREVDDHLFGRPDDVRHVALRHDPGVGGGPAQPGQRRAGRGGGGAGGGGRAGGGAAGGFPVGGGGGAWGGGGGGRVAGGGGRGGPVP